MWFVLALLSALFQVLRNMSMKHLGHALDDTINVWGRFTFILPFLAGAVFHERARVRAILPGSLTMMLGIILLQLSG